MPLEVDLGNVIGPKGDDGEPGSQWYFGTAITGTSTSGAVFSSSGIANARVNDKYINTSLYNVYTCTVAGNASVAQWAYFGNIKGEKGDDGTSVTIKGTVDNPSSLPQSGNEVGDGYIIEGDLYVWDGSQWNNVGKIRGPQGEVGPTGPQGQAATIQIGTVQTGTAGSEAQVTNSGNQNAAVFNFVIPRGATGANGQDGQDGQDGAPGVAATIAVGSVSSGQTAQVTHSGNATAAVFDFVLPKGDPGADGQDGAQGAQGPAGTAATITVGSVTSGSTASVTNVGDETNAIFNFVLEKGEKGDPWRIDKTYASIDAMNEGYATDGVPIGGIVAINTGDVEDEDNAKIYRKGDAYYEYLFDMSGARGIKGDPGQDGAQGPAGTAATIQIGNVSDGDTAQVTNSGSANAAILNFVLPRGEKGADGQDGAQGERGPAGTAATIQVGTVSSGTTASVTNVGTASAARFNFVLPKGDKGDTGETGEQGPKGDTGETGPKGDPGATPTFEIRDGHLYAIYPDE